MGKIITANEQNVIKTLVMLAENNIRDRKKELEDWDKSLEADVKVTIKDGITELERDIELAKELLVRFELLEEEK